MERIGTDTAMDEETVDVAVVGAGVVGAALARELAGRGASVALVEARADVGDVTSKANTAILHTGFDAKPGTVEARLVRRGYHLLTAYAERAGIPVEVPGALLVAWTDEQLAALPSLAERASANGYTSTRLIDAGELYRREPHLGPGALGALSVPDEGIICPWTTTLAYATEAVRSGARLLLETSVTGAEVTDTHVVLATTRGPLRARHVVNAAGLGSDTVHAMFGLAGFHVTPRRGQLIVFDKLARPLVGSILLPVPTAMGKGVLVAPTVYGNVMLGPTAEDLEDRTDTGSTRDGLADLREKGRRIVPELIEEEVTTVYAGLRAATEHADYQISFHPEKRYVCVGGIRSTGLTGSLAIAEYVAAELTERMGLALKSAEPGDPPRMPYIGEAATRPYADAGRIAADPAYGEIVCFCERVSRGEIRDALASDIPPRAVEGLRRRTRATMGRCQGFYCGATVRDLLEHGVGSPAGQDAFADRGEKK
jgi:glycerol-3-phosphate dehydrogenase